MIAALVLQTAAAVAAAREADYYTVDYLVQPAGERLEVGGLDFLPDGRLVCSTRRGQVWIVDDPLAADPANASFQLFCEGLHEGLGLEVVDGEIYVLQRGELSKLVDEDGDGTCDRIDTVAQGWGYSGHYHEFAFGLPRDDAGNFYASFNVSFGDPHWWHGRSTVPDRGWILRIHPDGTLERVASGARSPCGLGRTSDGRILYTDNQGDWMPACPIFEVTDGAFFGHPASLNWTPPYREARRTASDTVPPERERSKAALWLPYDWSRSTGNLVEDETGGAFGPFGGQLFVAEMTNGYVLRAGLEQVQGELQGWCLPFRHAVGSNVRLRFAPDGTLFSGFTDRGWGGQPPGDGIGRLRWTGKLPFEIANVRLLVNGFEIELTQPAALESVEALTALAADVGGAEIKQYDYNYWWEYGSPPQHVTSLAVTGAKFDDSRTKVALVVDGLEPGHVARVRLPDLRSQDGELLLHDEFAYTINQLPQAPRSTANVAKLVAPPEAREAGDEGLLYLTRVAPLDLWRGAGWRAVDDVQLSADDPERLGDDPGAEPNGWWGPAITNSGTEQPEDLVTTLEFGDMDFSVDFLLPARGESGILVMDRYEIRLSDTAEGAQLGLASPGGIDAAADESAWPGRAPTFDAFRGPGRWHSLSCMFQAPRFDASGQKIANAKFKRVMIDDTLLQEEVELPCPTRGAGDLAERRTGPLRLRGDRSPVAFRRVRVKSREPADSSGSDDGAGWTPIFDGRTLDGWQISDGGQWHVEKGEIVGSGPTSHLFSPRGDYQDLDLRAKVRVNDGGNSGMYFRAAYGSGWPEGYEAQINSSHPDPVKTGSLYGLSSIHAQLVPPDRWFDYRVTCRDESLGTHVVIRLNGIVVNDFVDAERRHPAGHIAFQQHHEGSLVRIKDIEVR